MLFIVIEITNFAPRERNEYIKDMTTERDKANQLATAVRTGRAEGRAEEKAEVARNLLKMGLSVEVISQATGLDAEAINGLLDPQH